MTPDRLRSCLAAIGWSQRGLADQLDCDERRVRRWASGVYEVPAVVAEWLERLAEGHRQLPAPRDWRNSRP